MDRKRTIEIAFETIKESTEWGIECEDKTYGNWIDGVVTVVDNIIAEMKIAKRLQIELGF